ncbi:MAG: ABC transporter ATP-binding protein [Candidatus Eisenbacteria bacterium]|uniref:ABC transporter ATP-binding protein n=1 Tax=Eiseniibacteriota bacterium TaxID=2212470 RepID=A0A948WF46_UNCEI|nr:ABC transporter ATP-binding protein [Candidatus Eisenbacteria bacterium]MBU1947183.1 ABC transporter ATP-binding protein [Candidatus Eisenbacteria bacterium]MBU2693368.1 ABC transporter ATP-binding protein [Candidatus Eisenbacteria bacterium]
MIDVRDLTRRFGDLTAVDALSFRVAPGELFGVVGPDGAGKTTLLRMLAGVLRPTAGDACLHGMSVARDPEGVKSEIAYMSQRFGLYADLTVLENISFYADLYRVPRRSRAARIERLFHFSGLEPFAHRLAGRLSGGMKQKLGLSCALIHEPQILLLDEPTFGVDPISRRDLWMIVHEMVGRGITVLVSTSYMDEAERFDRLALISSGRLLALDTPAALQSSLPGQLLSLRIERVRDAQALAARLPLVRRAAVFGDHLHLLVDEAQSDLPVIAAALQEAGFPVLDSEVIEPSFEDLFIDRVTAAEEGER